MDITKYLEEHCQNHTTELVSNENFGEVMGDAWRNLRHGKKEAIEAGRGDVEAILRRTYLNTTWLGKRRFITGDVSVKNGSVLKGNWKGDVDKAIQLGATIAAKDSAILIKTTKVIDPIIKFLSTPSDWKDEEKVLAFLPNAEIPDYEDPKWTPDPNAMKSAEKASLPALDAHQVVEVCNVLLKLVDARKNSSATSGAWQQKLAPVGGSSLFSYEEGPLFKTMAKHYHNEKMGGWLHDVWADLSEFAYAAEQSYFNAAEGRTHTYLHLSQFEEALISWIDASTK